MWIQIELMAIRLASGHCPPCTHFPNVIRSHHFLAFEAMQSPCRLLGFRATLSVKDQGMVPLTILRTNTPLPGIATFCVASVPPADLTSLDNAFPKDLRSCAVAHVVNASPELLGVPAVLLGYPLNEGSNSMR